LHTFILTACVDFDGTVAKQSNQFFIFFIRRIKINLTQHKHGFSEKMTYYSFLLLFLHS